MTDFLSALIKMGLPEPEKKLPHLEKYVESLLFWNRKINLIGPGNADIWERHIFDSLAGYARINGVSPLSVADLGTGGGLPGIPLAVFMPQTRFCLAERSLRKAGFLRNCVLDLDLDNVRVFEGPYEDMKDSFDLITFRAFQPLTIEAVHILKTICSEKTVIAAYKGRRETIDKELSGLNGVISEPEIISLSVPGLNEERNLVMFRIPL